MTCCHCQATERQFDAAFAGCDLKRYRRKGPGKTTRWLLEAIRESALRSVSLLDVGAGIGVIHHELLEDVAARAIHVEAASAYLAAARKETARRGHSEKVQFVHGDFTELAAELPESDVVTLDRVICCYPDFERLVTTSAAKARRLYAASYPRDRWYVKVVIAAQNLFRRVLGNEFRTFVHPVAQIEALLAQAGFKEHSRRNALVWEAVAFRRSDGG